MQKTIDLSRAYYEQPPDLDFVARGILSGTVAVLASPGGSGKSWLALMLAHAVAAADQPDADPLSLLGDPEDDRWGGKVLYVSLEDPPIIMRHRLWTCAQTYPSYVIRDCIERLTIQDASGLFFDIMRDDHLDALSRAADHMRLVIIDTLARAHGADENDNAAMTRVIRRFEVVAARTGAAILLLHHTKKGAAKERDADADVVRGASAIVNSARAVLAISRHAKADRIRAAHLPDGETVDPKKVLQISFLKCNYAPFPDPIPVARGRGGILRPCDIDLAAPPPRSRPAIRLVS